MRRTRNSPATNRAALVEVLNDRDEIKEFTSPSRFASPANVYLISN